MPPPDKPGRIELFVQSAIRPLAVVLTFVGVPLVIWAMTTGEGFREVAVEVALGLALLITTFLTRDQLRSTRRSRAATQLSDAGNLLAAEEPIARQVGMYLLSSLRTDRDVDRDFRDSADRLLEAALAQAIEGGRIQGSDLDGIIAGELAIETPDDVMAATRVRRLYRRLRWVRSWRR